MKTLDEMSLAELRIVAIRYDVKSGGIKKDTLKNRIKRKQKQMGETSDPNLQNLPSGESVTTADYETEDLHITVIDHDIEPHKEVEIDDLGEGVYRVQQKPAYGGQEDIIVTITDTPKGIRKKQKLAEYERLEAKKSGIVEPKKKVLRQSTQKHVVVKNNMIYPRVDILPPKAKPKTTRLTKRGSVRAEWKRYEQWKRDQRKILNEYEENKIIPFLMPKGFNYVPVSHFRNLSQVDIVAEKDDSIDSKLKKQFKKDKKIIHSTRGNKVQTQIFTSKQGDKEGKFAGLYTQKDANPSKINPTPTIKRLKKGGEIYVDDDDTGHFVAYYINTYSFNKPTIKNVWFKGRKQTKPISTSPFRANRFLAISIMNTLGLRQNQALKDVFEDVLGKGTMKYRREGDIVDLMPSEQIIRITRGVYDSMIDTNLQVATLENKFTFKGEIESFNEAKPILFFDSFVEEKARRLDSDLLLRGIVRKFSIEPDSSQALLETLYSRGWISYPRVKEGGEELEVSVELLRPIDNDKEFNKKFDAKLVNEWKNKGYFKGTTQESQILQLIKNAEVSFNKGESFIQAGEWVLQSGDEEWKTDGIWIAGDKMKYSHEEFDITVADRGITPEDLTVFLINNNIGTPATRTAQLNRLKNAGIIQLVGERYLVDSRGLYFVSATQLLEEKDIPLVLDQIELLKKASTIEQMKDLINDFILIDRDKFAEEIKIRGKSLIEAESDLAYLEGF